MGKCLNFKVMESLFLQLRLRLHDNDVVQNGKVFSLAFLKIFTYTRQHFRLQISAKTGKNTELHMSGQ